MDRVMETRMRKLLKVLFFMNPASKRYGKFIVACLAAGEVADKDVTIALKRIFTMTLEPSEEGDIEEQKHIYPQRKSSRYGIL